MTTKAQIIPLIDQLWLTPSVRDNYRRRLNQSKFAAGELEQQHAFFTKAIHRQQDTLREVVAGAVRSEDWIKAWGAVDERTDDKRLLATAKMVTGDIKRWITQHHQYSVPAERVREALVLAYKEASDAA